MERTNEQPLPCVYLRYSQVEGPTGALKRVFVYCVNRPMQNVKQAEVNIDNCATKCGSYRPDEAQHVWETALLGFVRRGGED